MGDRLLAAAFLSYCGPFDSEYRAKLCTTWIKSVRTLSSRAPDFDFAPWRTPRTCATGTSRGPADAFSTENGVMTRGTRGR